MQEKSLKDKLIKSFKNLDLNNQRNEFSKEMILISTLINICLSTYEETSNNNIAFNYNPSKDQKMTESELLTKNYEDIITIKNNLTLLISYMNNK